MMEAEPDFSFIESQLSRDLLINGYHAVSRCEAWSFLKTFEPEEDKGFYFTTNPKVIEIGIMMDSCPPNKPLHSGFSFAWTMRHMQAIATKGFDKYKEDLMNEPP
jgi:hypothetical protein